MDLHVASVVGFLLPFAINLAIVLVAIAVIPTDRRPSSSMAWILLIVAAPGLGLLAFLFFGRTKLEKQRHARHRAANEVLAASTAAVPAPLASERRGPPYLASAARLNRHLGNLPATLGNRADLLPVYADSLGAMAEAVRGARESVHVEFYISAWDDLTGPLFEAMAEAAGRGVKVRFLFDHLGSRGIPGYKDFTRRLADTGIEWHPMLPVRPLRGRFRRPDLRNHRKILVVDGVLGFTGSQNLTEPGYNKPKNHQLGREWVELMTRVEGPVVTTLNAVFATDWFVETGEDLSAEVRRAEPASYAEDLLCQVVPSGPGFPSENNLRLFTTLVYGAQRRLSVTSPYFVPDESLLYAITTAAQRGVAVELFVNEAADQFMVDHAQCSYYRSLLRAGVRIHLYPAPAILHSKHFTVDEDVAVIGSSNMDMRSFALNYEVSVMVHGESFVSAMRQVEDGYREAGRELTLEEWNARGRRTRLLDNAMRLTAALQ